MCEIFFLHQPVLVLHSLGEPLWLGRNTIKLSNRFEKNSMFLATRKSSRRSKTFHSILNSGEYSKLYFGSTCLHWFSLIWSKQGTSPVSNTKGVLTYQTLEGISAASRNWVDRPLLILAYQKALILSATQKGNAICHFGNIYPERDMGNPIQDKVNEY